MDIVGFHWKVPVESTFCSRLDSVMRKLRGRAGWCGMTLLERAIFFCGSGFSRE